MKIELSAAQISELRNQHKKERDRRIADRIKSVVLHCSGWSNCRISEALLLNEKTIQRHLQDYVDSQKLKPENGGSSSFLDDIATNALITHLENNTYQTVHEICAYVESEYGITYTVSGMTKWLHNHKFSYKEPKKIPAKASPEAQAAWVEEYKKLTALLPEDEVVMFADGVHPSMQTKVTSGWIRVGKNKTLETTASRTRVNIVGSIELKSMNVVATSHQTIDSDAMEQHFKQLREQYPEAKVIHLIVDNGPYNTSEETAKYAKKYNINLRFLPTYSPNLNPIERLWKIMNEYVRNNKFFNSAKEFRQKINDFFNITWKNIAQNMRSRINDNFQTLQKMTTSC